MSIFFTRAAPSDSGFADFSPWLSVGEESFPRWFVESYVASPASQVLHGQIITARKSEDINSLRIMTGTASAGATPTLVRVGVYEWDDVADTGSLIHSSANDTSLFSNTFTIYTIPLTTTWPKVAGVRYALAVLIDTGAAVPNFQGSARIPSGTVGNVMELEPRMAALRAFQSDLPATFTPSTLGGVTQLFYWRMLP